MNSRLITEIALVVAIVVLVGWDIYADVNAATGDTISEVTLGIARNVPMIPLALGVVCGHLFMDAEMWPGVWAFVKAHPLVPFLYGVVGGALCWYQGRP